MGFGCGGPIHETECGQSPGLTVRSVQKLGDLAVFTLDLQDQSVIVV